MRVVKHCAPLSANGEAHQQTHYPCQQQAEGNRADGRVKNRFQHDPIPKKTNFCLYRGVRQAAFSKPYRLVKIPCRQVFIQASARHVTHKKWIFAILSVPGCENFDQKTDRQILQRLWTDWVPIYRGRLGMIFPLTVMVAAAGGLYPTLSVMCLICWPEQVMPTGIDLLFCLCLMTPLLRYRL